MALKCGICVFAPHCTSTFIILRLFAGCVRPFVLAGDGATRDRQQRIRGTT